MAIDFESFPSFGNEPSTSIEDYIRAQEEDKRLGFVGNAIGGLGTQFLLHKLLPLVTKRSVPAMLTTALAGALWGGARTLIEDRPLTELPGNIAEEAAWWGAPGPMIAANLGQTAFQTAIGRKPLEEGLVEAGMMAPWALLSARAKWALDPVVYKSLGKLMSRTPEVGYKQASQEAGELAWSMLKPEREFIANTTIIPKRYENFFGGRTVAELMQAPQERMSRKGQQMFFSHEARTANINEAMNEVMKNMRTLDPEDRALASRFMQSGMKTEWLSDRKLVTSAQQAKLLEVFAPFKNTFKEINSRFTQMEREYIKAEFSDNIAKEFQKIAPENEFVSQVSKGLAEASDFGDIQKNLKKAIKNGFIPDDARAYAVHLYDLPFTGSEAINKAYREASMDLLKYQLVQSPEFVVGAEEFSKLSPELQKSFKFVPNQLPKDLSGLSDFKGEYVNTDVYHAIQAMSAPSYANSWWSKFIVQPWKITRAVARFPSMFRNITGNFIYNDILGKNSLPLWRMDFYRQVVSDWKNGAAWVQQFEKESGMKMATFTKEEFTALEKELKYNSSMMDVALNLFGKTVSPFTKTYQSAETFAKLAKYKWNLEHGMESQDAMIDAVRATFHYGEVPLFVKKMRETLWPFATWQSKTLGALPEAIIKHPIRVMKYVAIPWMITQAALQNLDISEPEWKEFKDKLPDYLQHGMYMILPWRDEKNRLQMFNLTWWLPGLGDVSEYSSTLGTPGKWIQNPLFNVVADLRSNKKGQTNTPIYFDWDDPITKITKTLNYVYQQFMPTWSPGVGSWQGGFDWEVLRKAFRGEEEAATPAQAISAQFGLKSVPVDEAVMLEKRKQTLLAVERDVKMQMKKELKRAVSDEEKQNIVNKYQAIITRLTLKGGL